MYQKQQARWGGARNKADRTSNALSHAQLAHIIAAAEHSILIGLPLNRFITIHWQKAGITPDQIAKATSRYTDLLSKALKREGHNIAYIWVHEGGKTEGAHCHLLCHVPAECVSKINGKQRSWLKQITARPYERGVIKSRPVGSHLGHEQTNPELYVKNLSKCIDYMLKGASAELAAVWGLTRHSRGGPVIGKRCGTSQNIGQKARVSQAKPTIEFTSRIAPPNTCNLSAISPPLHQRKDERN